jgi:hypothetical protein
MSKKGVRWTPYTPLDANMLRALSRELGGEAKKAVDGIAREDDEDSEMDEGRYELLVAGILDETSEAAEMQQERGGADDGGEGKDERGERDSKDRKWDRFKKYSTAQKYMRFNGVFEK